MKTNTIIIISLIVLTIVSISLCGYFGLELEKRKSYDKGLNDGEIRLANQIIQGGRKITTDTGVILFVPAQ